jgi:fatty-acid desaturase
MTPIDLSADASLAQATMEPTSPTLAGAATDEEVDSGSAPAISSNAASQAPATSLDAPVTTKPTSIYWMYAIPLAVIHLLSLLVFVPYCFSWSGLALAILGHFTFGLLGITVGYHRLLTHRGFACPKWFEHTLAIMGICNLQDSPARWVAVHRLHHMHSDEQPDPHSPLVNFLWGHVGWLVVVNRDHRDIHAYERFARDLLRERFYFNLERQSLWLFIYLGHALLFTLAGFGAGYGMTGSWAGATQLGLSWLVWAVIARTVFVLNGTWAVNSLGHMFGYQNYNTGDHSRNNWLVGLLAHGEGWHNNHHADQRSARHGHRWWEFDISWQVIRVLEMIGLVWDVARPSEKLQATRAGQKISG